MEYNLRSIRMFSFFNDIIKMVIIMKKIIIYIINIFILILFLILTVSLTIKDITIDTAYKTTISTNIKENIKKEYPEIEQIEDEEIKNIISKYIDVIARDEDITITNEVEKILNKYNISEEQKEEIISKVNEKNDEIIETVKKEYVPSERDKFMLSVYNFLDSNILRVIIIILIFLFFILIVSLQESLYKWMKEIGSDLIIVGLSIIFILPNIITNINNTSLDISSIIDLGKLYFMIGIVLIIIFLIIYYIKKRKLALSIDNC